MYSFLQKVGNIGKNLLDDLPVVKREKKGEKIAQKPTWRSTMGKKKINESKSPTGKRRLRTLHGIPPYKPKSCVGGGILMHIQNHRLLGGEHPPNPLKQNLNKKK